MKKFYLQKILCLLLIFFSVFSVAPLQAASIDGGNQQDVFLPIISSSTDLPADVILMQQQAESFERLVTQMEQHMHISDDGTIVLDFVIASSANAIDAATYATLIESLNDTNQQLASGNLSLADISLHTDFSQESSASVSAASMLYCNGISRTDFYWWGYTEYFNSCQANNLVFAVNLITAGAGVCAGTAAGTIFGMPVALVCAVSAGASGVSSAVLQWASNPGRGIIMHVTWAFIPFYVGSQ